MKRTWLIAVLALVAAGLALTGWAASGPAQAATARPAHVSVQAVVFDCPGQHAMVRPKDFIIACADANMAVEKLTWTSWTPGEASAQGTLVENDCIPYCAAGHFHSYPALAVLWGSQAVRPGEQAYTRLTMILTGARPRYYDGAHHKWVYAPVTQTFPLVTSSAGA